MACSSFVGIWEQKQWCKKNGSRFAASPTMDCSGPFGWGWFSYYLLPLRNPLLLVCQKTVATSHIRDSHTNGVRPIYHSHRAYVWSTINFQLQQQCNAPLSATRVCRPVTKQNGPSSKRCTWHQRWGHFKIGFVSLLFCLPQRLSRMPVMSTSRGEVRCPPYFADPSAYPCWSQALRPVSEVFCCKFELFINYQKGVFVGFKYIRGCADRVLIHGFNQTALQIHRFAQAIPTLFT